jgi:hypothetical protein
MEEEGSKVIGGGISPGESGPKGLKALESDLVASSCTRRGVLLTFQIEEELSAERVFGRHLAAA